MLDLLAAILFEGAPASTIDRIQQGSCSGASQIFLLIYPRKLGSEAFTDQIANSVVNSVYSSDPSETSTETLYPGESAPRTRHRQLAQGIAVDEGIWAEVLTLAGKP